ncbi:Ig-like domain repeat protein [Aeromicrobium sp. CF4.19]|uniref:Ig-like domain repeat protein n=1 Tax=Aeromicrobium sp. CF4.19 TaxID=3373082 RepID=UPI003EE81BAD
MSITTRARRGLVAALGLALASGALASAAAPASSDPVGVDDAQFRWGLSNEANNGAFAPGTFNFLSAGLLGNPGTGGQTVTAASQGQQWSNDTDAGWSATSGNVSIEKKQSDGSYAAATWDGLNKDAEGQPTSPPTSTRYSGHQVVIDEGSGTIDAAANTADISWDGDFSVVAYSGMSYFHLSDPELTIEADGTGELTATASGYGSDMNDMDQWNPLEETEVVLATFTDVDVEDTGFTRTPSYLGTAYAHGSHQAQTPRTSANEAFWGSFPQSFVDFAQQVGAGPYWYSSGGAVDVAKPALPFELVVPEAPAPAPEPAIDVDVDEIAATGDTEITVTGTGFDPAASPAPNGPAGLTSGGAYVALGRFADVWQPSDGAPGTARTTIAQKWALPESDHTLVGGPAAGAIALEEDGSFTTTFTTSRDQVENFTGNPEGNLGIYTYTRSPNPSFETYTPITVEEAVEPDPEPITTTTTVTGLPTTATLGDDLTATVTVASEEGTPQGSVTTTSGDDELTTSTLSDGAATVDLSDLGAGTHDLRFAYDGNDDHAASETTTTLVINEPEEEPEPEPAGTTTTVTGLPTTATLGEDITATVTVASEDGTPAGSVTTHDGDTELSTDDLSNGTTTVDLSALDTGSHDLRFTYDGNEDHAASETTTTLVINEPEEEPEPEPAGTTTTVTGLPTTATLGDDLTATVTVASEDGTPAGSVTTHDGDTELSTDDLSNGTTTVDLSALDTGSHDLRFTYDGNDDHAASETTTTLVINEPEEEPEPEPSAPEASDLTDGNRGDLTVPSSVEPGETITVTVSDSLVGERVHAWLLSDPVDLGAVTVGEGGEIQLSIPADVRAGDHRLVITDEDGAVIAWRDLSVAAVDEAAPIEESTDETDAAEVSGDGTTAGPGTDPVPAADAGSLPAAGAPAVSWTLGVVLLLVGAAVVALGRRRRTT